MSNYTIAVNWTGKDALPNTDPGKVISGTDFNTEFVAVRTSVNSKADLNGDATENFTCNLLTADSATIDGQVPSLLDTPQTYTKAHNTQAETLSMTADQTANLLNTDVFVVEIQSTGHTLNVSNQTAGTKAKFIVKNQGAHTLTLGTGFYLPEGATYTATSGSGSVDVLDCVSDGTSLYCNLSSNY